LSRFCAAGLIYTQNYVRESGKAKPLAKRMSGREFMLAAIFGMAPLALLAPYFSWTLLTAVLLPVVLVWLWFWRLLARRLGGYTGDCLGAMQQFAELAFYLGVIGVAA
jgi:adenosylcobinamide-GDP ribazoletransferase